MRGHFFRSRQNVHKMYVHVHMYVNLLLGTQCNVINIININVLLQLMRIMQMITSWLYDTRLLGINSYAQIPTGITAELWYISSQPVVHSDQCFFVCLIVCLFAWLCGCLLDCVFICLIVCLFACLFVCLLVWNFSSHSRIFYYFGDVTITSEGLQILTYAWHL